MSANDDQAWDYDDRWTYDEVKEYVEESITTYISNSVIFNKFDQNPNPIDPPFHAQCFVLEEMIGQGAITDFMIVTQIALFGLNYGRVAPQVQRDFEKLLADHTLERYRHEITNEEYSELQADVAIVAKELRGGKAE